MVLLALAALFAPSHPVASQSFSFGSQPVGAVSGEQNIAIAARSAGTVATVQVLTLGVSGLDFAPGSGAMTCASATLSAGSACTESVSFTPASPGLRIGAVVLLDSNNIVLGSTFLSGAGTAGIAVLVPGNLLPVAGNGTATGPILDGNPATSASLNLPAGIVLDGAGNLYIADTGHNRIRKVTASSELISTLAGNGDPAYAGDGLPSTSAAVSLHAPGGAALDGAGNLYIADTGNNVVREIAASTGVITTVAGTGQQGAGGDGLPATAATLNQPQAVSIDATGNLYIADTANHRIRRVDRLTGVISTIAGNGTTNPATGAGGYSGDGGPASSAELNFPFAVAFDPAGDMVIPDSANNAVRIVAAVNGVIAPTAIITTIAGTGVSGDTGDGAAATSATLSSPSGVAVDAAGNIYIADTQNSAIRKVSSASGFISTIAKNGPGEYVANNAGPFPISIDAPIGLSLDGSGNLYFADSANNRIREIQGNLALLDFTANPVGQGSQSPALSQTLENDGNAPLDLASIIPGSNAALDASATTCATGAPLLQPDGDCVIGAIFAPATAGDPLFGQIDIAANAVNSPLEIELIGDATPVASTTTMLASSANPSGFGQPITFTATVTTTAGSGEPTGNLTFLDGANRLGNPVPLNSSGIATFTSAVLAVGVHPITASYAGDNAHSASTSAVLNQTVLEATSTTLISSVNPSAVGQSITFTATVAASGGGGVAPTGTVTFTDGSTTLSTSSLSPAGVATYTTASLTNGPHAIVATYNGVAANQVSSSVSSLLKQQVLVASQVAVTSAPNPSRAGSPVTFNATVTSSGSNIPTGTVNILDGEIQIGTATLAASAAGTFITASLAVGSHTITAAYPGDSNNAPSTSAPIVQVVSPVGGQAPTSTILTATPDPSVAQSAVKFTGTVTGSGSVPTGSLAFLADGASIGSAALTAKGVATLNNASLTPGTHTIVAAYAGDAGNAASTSLPISQVVGLIPTAAALTSSTTASGVSLAAAVSANTGPTPTGTVTFLIGTATLGTAQLGATGVATLTPNLPGGTYTIVASYGGDALHAPSASQAIVIKEAPSTFSLAVAPSTLTMALSRSATSTVTLTADARFSDTVALACASLPSGVTCQFSSPNVTLTTGATATAQLTITTGATVAADASPKAPRATVHPVVLAGLLPFGAAFGCLFFRRVHRRGKSTAAFFSLLFAAAILFSGCAGVHLNKTAQAYVIQITGTGLNSHLVQSQNVTLNIEQ